MIDRLWVLVSAIGQKVTFERENAPLISIMIAKVPFLNDRGQKQAIHPTEQYQST